MKHSRTDIQATARTRAGAAQPGKTPGHIAVPGRRGGLRHLPRPLYGHIDSQSNILIPRRHKHTWAQLSYATQGFLQVWTPKARFVALSHRAVWIPAGVMHQVRQSPHTVIRSLYLDATALGLDWTACRVLAVSPLLLAMFGPGLGDSVPILCILIAGSVGASLFGPGEDLLTMLGGERLCAGITAGSLLAAAGLCLALVPALGTLHTRIRPSHPTSSAGFDAESDGGPIAIARNPRAIPLG